MSEEGSDNTDVEPADGEISLENIDELVASEEDPGAAAEITPKSVEASPPPEESKEEDQSGDMEISLENIDDIIGTEDPKFSESMNEMQSEAEEVKSELSAEADEQDLQPESVVDEEQEQEKEKEKVTKLTKIKLKVARFLKPFAIIILPLRLIAKPLLLTWYLGRSIYVRIKNKLYFLFRAIIQYFKKDFVGQVKSIFISVSTTIKKVLSWLISFKSLSLKRKSLVILFIGLVGFFSYFVKVVVKNQQFLKFEKELLVGFHEVATKVTQFNPEEELVQFYLAFPQPSHNFLMDKIVVNLTREPGHASPMGAFEFFINLDSKDTAIELKDRQKEFIDLLQRTVEELRYRELETTQGKVKLKNNIKLAFNRVLNQGRVKSIAIKTIILKP